MVNKRALARPLVNNRAPLACTFALGSAPGALRERGTGGGETPLGTAAATPYMQPFSRTYPHSTHGHSGSRQAGDVCDGAHERSGGEFRAGDMASVVASAGRHTSRTSDHSREDEMNADAAGSAAVSRASPQTVGKDKHILHGNASVGASVMPQSRVGEQDTCTVGEKRAASSKPTRHQEKNMTASVTDGVREGRAEETPTTGRLASNTTAMPAPQPKYALAPHDDVRFRKFPDQDSFEEPIGHGLLCSEEEVYLYVRLCSGFSSCV